MADRHGPLRTGRFVVEIDGVQVDGFQVVDLPARSTKETEYREGSDPDHQRKLAGGTEYEDLTMERGAKKNDASLYEWRRSIDQGKMEEGRKDLAVVLQDENGEAAIRWEFTNAWPKRYDPPTLDATAEGGGVATESVTIVFDEMQRPE
ncbi:phage tail protein [Haloglomus halophilum]|uniref:phage tail protein n=1 Tax=Haloglomus halophilum TaxID=2962672 RepID=UPI0020CA0D0A|nr:phage tail protein [Haloglomus halophilum]